MPAKLCSSFFLFCFILSSTEAVNFAKPGCQDKCGNISIPYPFGIGINCSIDRWAEVKCDTRFSPPKLFFSSSITTEVVQFSLPSFSHQFEDYVQENIIVHIKNNISMRICSNVSGGLSFGYDPLLGLHNTPFTLSRQMNSFTLIGCNMYGVIGRAFLSEGSEDFPRACTTDCDKIKYCQVGLPAGKGEYNMQMEALYVSGSNKTRCGSAFVSDGYQDFKASDIEFLKETTVALDFRFTNQSCEHACKNNSSCESDYSVDGYFCSCNSGYYGNPYLDQGCQDINECDQPNNPCSRQHLPCINTEGFYECEYQPQIMKKKKHKSFIWIILGVGLPLFLLSLGMYYIKRKQMLKLSEKLTSLNARLLLIQEISSHTKIFTARKLQQATNNYHESRILGEGGYGTVYKGILPDKSEVAIKKSKLSRKSQFDDFINEVAILTKINHRNIVKLLGCSVETEHPLLVYEFVPNGTLSEHIFKKSGVPYSSMSWENRLRIAAEIAGALAYLHSAASTPVIHRDVKSSNILLDDNFAAKVADFGVSKVNHLDQTEIGTLVKGTPGYLDPEYMRTSQLTEKSDVFSFGVVLAELLTGKKSISFERAQGERNLAIYFNASMDEEQLLHIIEEGMVNEENIREVRAVAMLVKRCVNFKGGERPFMKEVASELEALISYGKNHSSF